MGMLVVSIEVWPGGRMLQRRVIHTMTLANVSDLAEVSDYTGFVDGEPIEVHGHRRADGAWVLVQKALEAHLDDR